MDFRPELYLWGRGLRKYSQLNHQRAMSGLAFVALSTRVHCMDEGDTVSKSTSMQDPMTSDTLLYHC